MKAPLKSNDGKLTDMPDHELWIRTHDNIHKTAKEIVEELTLDDWIDLACIGAGCLNTAIKCVAIARETLLKNGLDCTMQPFFSTVIDDRDRERTRIILRVSRIANVSD